MEFTYSNLYFTSCFSASESSFTCKLKAFTFSTLPIWYWMSSFSSSKSVRWFWACWRALIFFRSTRLLLYNILTSSRVAGCSSFPFLYPFVGGKDLESRADSEKNFWVFYCYYFFIFVEIKKKKFNKNWRMRLCKKNF